MTSIGLSYGELDKHWFSKNNLCMNFGTIALLCPAWHLVTPLTFEHRMKLLVMAFWVGTTVQLQDYRDTVGDKADGRSTLPIWLHSIVGENIGRFLFSLVLVLCPVGVGLVSYYFNLLYLDSTNQLSFTSHWECDLVATIWHWVMAIRLYFYREKEDDNLTYAYLVYLFNFVLFFWAPPQLRVY